MRCAALFLLAMLVCRPALAEDVLRYTGVNLSGAEFGGTGGTHGYQYIYPTASAAYFRGKGMNTFRLPFRWERLQPTLGGDFAAGEWELLQDSVAALTAGGAAVLLDVHNYARHRGKVIGAADGPTNEQFADLWRRLALRWKDDRRVIFGLMNEPHGLPGERWAASANHAIATIRAQGARNLILVPGVAWTGAGSWYATWYGTANAVTMLSITDPGDNFAFEVHMYVDRDSSGTHDEVAEDDPDTGADRLARFTEWCRANGKRGFLGEFATPASELGLETAERTLAHMSANNDVWIGWTWWSAGPWWGDYMFSVQPTGSGGDKPQMPVLLRHASDAVIDLSTNAAPSVSAGPDRAISVGASADLDGAVNDDGLPGPAVTRTWTKVSGPGAVAFANSHATDTTVRVDAAGTYVLRLAASDGSLSATDTVTMTAYAGPLVTTATVTISGTVKAGTTALTVDGTPVVVSGSGAFQLTMPVPTSAAVHTLMMTDAQGRTTTRTLTLAPVPTASDPG